MEISDPRFGIWERRLLDAIRTSGRPKADIIKTFEAVAIQARKRAGLLYRQSIRLKDEGRRMDFLEAQQHAIGVEIVLGRERDR